MCPFHAITGWWCPLCGSTRGVDALLQGDVLAAFSSNLLLIVTLPVLAWGAVALAGVGAIRAPWTVPARVWVALGAIALVYTVLRNLPIGAALAP